MISKELEEIHKVDFKMLEIVTTIFEKNNLSYFLIAGTLLGAVRHRGFIPWDDDLDIGVPRSSYDLFLSEFKSELPDRYEVQNFKTDVNAKYYITRIIDKKVKVKELRDSSEENVTYASIDLFPIDGTPNNPLFRNIYILRVMYLRLLVSISQTNNIDMKRKRGLLETFLVKIVKKLPIDGLINRQSVFYRLDKILSKYSIDNSLYVGSLMGAYRKKELFQKKIISKYKKIQFESNKFYVPYFYDDYLNHMYGDYMKIPSKESISSKRHFSVISD
ncbi:LicD family protein [Companilactobacillus zhachilii]|uniref:LicD family protein n=1 Tax=Companilactobacillus zhachilii TaxID=2304606 RepID=UPI0019214DD9|nr:LicD family protein [Companilactobacillus zhachilii]MBL3532023.1 LicD family protein [Companilactobacillus zhachilii]